MKRRTVDHTVGSHLLMVRLECGHYVGLSKDYPVLPIYMNCPQCDEAEYLPDTVEEAFHGIGRSGGEDY